MRTEHSLRPILAAGLGVFILSCMDATMKVVSAAYPIGQVVGLRYASGATVALVAFALLRGPTPTWDSLGRNLLRAVVVLCTAATFFTAIARLPLAQAIALTFMAPLLMALMGRLILKEPIAPRALVGIVVGFLGVVVIASGQARDDAHSLDPVGLAAALACAIFYALSMVMMRQQSAKDSTITIVAMSNVLAFLLVTPLMAVQWQPLVEGHALVFALAGLLGTGGHLCLAWAYSRAHAGRLGILEYTAFIWGSVFGFLLFSEVPTIWTIVGASMIIVACLFSAMGRTGATTPILAEDVNPCGGAPRP